MTEKPFSQSCENNKRVILSILEEQFSQAKKILEIGSGNAQHAVYFAAHLPNLIWQISDRVQNHQAILAWMADFPCDNLLAPLTLDVLQQSDWPQQKYDGVFSANTAHIMGWPAVKKMFQGVATVLQQQGLFIQYGPFNKDAKFSSESNRNFQAWLKQQSAEMGIRDITDLKALASEVGLSFVDEIAMPANNLMLIWQKR